MECVDQHGNGYAALLRKPDNYVLDWTSIGIN